MGEFVYLNGRIVSQDEARISPFDRGFLYGDGLFETMRASGGRVHLLRRHLARLASSMRQLEMATIDEAALRNAVEETLQANGVGEWVLRLTATRGVPAGDPGTLMIHVRPLLHRWPHTPAALVVLDTPHPGGRGVKSTSYQAWSLGAMEAERRGGIEGVFLDRETRVVEGTISNLFRAVDGEIQTPPLELGGLPGIARARVLELAGTIGVRARERSFTREELHDSDEVFFTNAVRGVVPVRSIDGRALPDGHSLALRLGSAFEAECPDEEV